ncbi:RNA polymerase sigma factor [Gaoshiqia sp. Z1-71]|uniref:RNA polymerase sigma factor n=1 Tax=Gaoshiqia hydrogeniformans TaxID=3290090 RepID=UPI003BF7E9AC
MEHLNETDLIKRVLDGEPRAYSVLLKRYQRPVHALIRQMIPCREDAEELAQDVFVKAFGRLDSFRGGSGLSTWLYRIAYNTTISYTRKKKLRYPDIDDKALDNIPDETVDELLDREDDETMMQQIEAAVEQLNPEDKALISLYYTQGKSVKELSDITALSADNVKIKLFRVRKKIVFLINNKNHER